MSEIDTLRDWGVTRAEACDLVRRQMCPACGEGPWKSPLLHASRKHGIDPFDMRDACGLTVDEPVTDPETHEKFATREVDPAHLREMTKQRVEAAKNTQQRLTAAGRESLSEVGSRSIERNRATTAEAAARSGATRARNFREKWDAMTADERAAFVAVREPNLRIRWTRGSATPTEQRRA